MASMQQAGGMAYELSNKEKAITGEAMKEAQSVLANNITSQAQLVLVTGVMKNNQARALRLNKTHSWTGDFIVKPSETMSEGKAKFVHEGAAWQGNLPVVVGSKGVVIYGHYDRALPQLGWLLAWDKTAQASGNINKVYVEAGELNRLMNLDMNDIEHKLDASHNISRYWDIQTGAAAVAEIKNQNGQLIKETMSSEEQVDQQLTVEEKATISELIKAAQTFFETNNDGPNEVPLATVTGAMKNSQPRPLMLNKMFDGSGVFLKTPPTNLGGDNDIGTFIQTAPPFPNDQVDGEPGLVNKGCEAAVIYGTFDDSALPQLGYLLAWFKAQSSDEHKVYVETGELNSLMNMEWEEIEHKLHASTNESRYWDCKNTGAYAYAEIELLGDNVALLGASFDVKLIGETEDTSES